MYEQLDIFSAIKQPYKITKPVRLIELFAGVGSQAMALKRLGANFEHYRVVEFEKAEKVNSNTQLYKQAGNSIVVNVLVAILGQLLPGKENVYKEINE